MKRFLGTSILALGLVFAGAAHAIDDLEFTSGGHRLVVSVHERFPYPWLTLDQESALLVTHDSHFWDERELTWPAISQLTGYFAERGLPKKFMATIEERSTAKLAERLAQGYFPPGVEREDIFPFQGDSHRIVFRGKNLVAAGGNFTICACNTVRSALLLSEPKLGPLTIWFAMDAMYENPSPTGWNLAKETKTLLSISDLMSDGQFLQYLKTDFLSDDGLPCQINFMSSKDRSFRYAVVRNGKHLGQIGNGKELVTLNFDSARRVLRQISR